MTEGVVQLLFEHGAESTSPLRGADAETQVRVLALNDPGSLYDTTSTTDASLYTGSEPAQVLAATLLPPFQLLTRLMKARYKQIAPMMYSSGERQRLIEVVL
jgi:hypothetical protein